MTNIPDEEFERQLKEGGFTLKTYKRQLGVLLAIENVKRMDIGNKIVITSQEVEKHYKEHPVYKNERYHLHMATFNEKELSDYKKQGTLKKLSWDDLGNVEKEDIDPRFASVISMKKGEITEPIKSQDKYILIKLANKKEKRLATLDERYGDIDRGLHEAKKQKVLTSFYDDIEKKASIVYP